MDKRWGQRVPDLTEDSLTRSIDTMSRPIARVAFAILVSLVLIAATYMTVQGALPKVDTRSAQSHIVNGLKTNLNHDRSTVSELQTLQMQSDLYSQPSGGTHQGGGCESENRSSPDD